MCGGVAWSWEAPPLHLEGVVLGVPTSESCSAQSPRCGALTVTQRLLLALFLSLSSPINTAVITKYSRYAQRLPPPALAHGGRWEAGEWHNPARGTQGRGTDAPGERRQIPSPKPRHRPHAPSPLGQPDVLPVAPCWLERGHEEQDLQIPDSQEGIWRFFPYPLRPSSHLSPSGGPLSCSPHPGPGRPLHLLWTDRPE